MEKHEGQNEGNIKDRMKKQDGQNGETGRMEWRNRTDRMQEQEGQNGEQRRIEWRCMTDRMKKHEGQNGETEGQHEET